MEEEVYCFTGVPECIGDERLESTVTSVLSDTDVAGDVNCTEDCHCFGKIDSKSQYNKIIVCLVNKRFCKKALLNKKN